MKQEKLTVLSNRPLTKGVYEMKLAGDTSAFSRPGQFLNIAPSDLRLRSRRGYDHDPL